MASAMLGGLLRAGMTPAQFIVVEPHGAQRDKLAAQFGVQALPAGDASLAGATTVVWAVKPQLFAEAAAPLKAWVGQALQLSVMAGITTASIAAASGSERVVRAMPNTPALIGQGIAGLFARPAVSADERATVERLLAPTGQTLWVDREDDLDAVTALSGSGPAYFFFPFFLPPRVFAFLATFFAAFFLPKMASYPSANFWFSLRPTRTMLTDETSR